ncbi:homeobox-leucine zipper protein HAT5-like [Hibiscus syriacus]|uniref:Homeobox-leucine zipper protein HAT5-like n=1 Tax=Hibiscus syriacus TaxID=106335 RepID=A0A6A3ANM5_HIBSY|nr:homeobox-leucine zipper protein HAT5-like [Hibiscus syriacus]
MDLEKVFHMSGGVGKTSYAQNSSLQKKASDMVKHITLETIQQLYNEVNPKSLGIADLGCSSGPNTLSLIKDIVELSKEVASLPDFHRDLKKDRNGRCPAVFIAGCPGSFYGRLFPNNCLHFIYSSYSLHWLSKVPPGLYDEHGKSINKGGVCISESSPPSVSQAYWNQFQEDISLFLKSRSEELVTGGRMVLITLGRIGQEHVDRGNSFFWEILSKCLAISVSQGEIEKEKLECYDVHFYAASRNEIEDEVRREGSFELERMEMLEIKKQVKGGDGYSTGVAMTVRAIQESMLYHHFGDGINLDTLFNNYAKMVDQEMANQQINPITFLLLLKKL